MPTLSSLFIPEKLALAEKIYNALEGEMSTIDMAKKLNFLHEDGSPNFQKMTYYMSKMYDYELIHRRYNSNQQALYWKIHTKDPDNYKFTTGEK